MARVRVERVGPAEVYVQPFPGPGAKRQLSTGGGIAPVWGRRSLEIFYRNDNGMLAATYSTQPVFQTATPRVLFEGRFEEHGLPHWPRNYDIAPDGDRFLMVGGSEEPPSVRRDVVLEWFVELGERLPARGG